MEIDACGCLWDWEGDTLNILPCENDRDLVAKAQRIAWKLVARRQISFREAWGLLWVRIIAHWIHEVKRAVE